MVTWRQARRSLTDKCMGSPLRCQAIERLFQGLDASDVNWLLSDKINSSLYIFDHEAKSVSRLTSSEVPWPVLFMLGRRHKKFRFLSNSMPTQSQLREALDDASSKLKWNNFFAERDDKHVGPPRTLLFRKKVASFTGTAAPEVNDFCARMSQRFRDGALQAVSRCFGRARRHGNVLPIDRAAHAWLENSNFAAVPCDKETGYCLVNLQDFDAMQSSILSKDWYREADPFYIGANHWSRSLMPYYAGLAKKIAEVDDRVTVSRIMSSLQFGRSRYPAQLMHTVKTHKKAGLVTFRPVHASSNHPFTGIMAWINLVTDMALTNFRHVLRSCDDLLRHVRSLEAVTDMIWLHFDIKDFFMQGSTEFLVHHASMVVPKRFRQVYRLVLTFVLDHQFVTCRRNPTKIYKVVCGTGMGLKCSSVVADAAFLHAVELCSIGLCLKRTQERSGILFYRRFRDNLLFAWRPDFVKIKQMVVRLEAAAPYTGEIEEASPSGVDFLDVRLFHDVATRKISFSPLLKATALTSVLSLHSAHPLSVHGAWLKAYLYRIRKRSSSLEWYLSFKAEVLRRLDSYGLDRTILAALDKETVFTFPVQMPAIDCRRPRTSVFRIVIPFHPVWQRDILKVCADMSQDLKALQAPGLVDLNKLSISWQLKSPALGSVILKY